MKKILIILGPTGVGKTHVSMLLSKALQTEIISSDSMQIYRHMDIGTAKPSIRERQEIKHHMIDIIEPWEYYSTGEYINDVQPIINEIHENKKIPIVVGGTGLYIKAMTRGIFKGPSADWDLRDRLLKREEKERGYVYEYLKSIDPESASRIMPTDIRRIVRALEVSLKSDKSMSDMQRLKTEPLPYEFIKIGLTRHREELYQIIEQRVDNMIKQGLIEEVKDVLRLIEEHSKGVMTLSDQSNVPSILPSMQAIGYKEIALYLTDKISLEDSIKLIKKRSKMYAKRQFTWFKKEEGINWIDITGIYDPEKVFKKITDRFDFQDI